MRSVLRTAANKRHPHALDDQPERNHVTDTTILLDRKTKAHRTADRWVIQRLKTDGSWDMVANWTGGRRSLLHWCAKNDVHPSREAEAALAVIPEATGFKERQ